MATNSEKKKLYRSRQDRLIAGVAGGLGEYFEIDATIVRVVFIALTLGAGVGFVLYFLCWLLIPVQGEKATSPEEIGQRVEAMGEEIRHAWRERGGARKGKSSFAAWILIVLGVIFLLDNYGIPAAEFITRLWPLALIGLGWWLLQRYES